MRWIAHQNMKLFALGPLTETLTGQLFKIDGSLVWSARGKDPALLPFI